MLRLLAAAPSPQALRPREERVAERLLVMGLVKQVEGHNDLYVWSATDEGCDLFPSCLRCPFPRCRHDAQPEGRRPTRMPRDNEIVMQWELGGKSMAELADIFGVSKRTVQRIIRRSSSEQHISAVGSDP